VRRSFRRNSEASKIINPHSYVSCPSALISSLTLLWQETSKLFFTTQKHGALCSFLKNSISGIRKNCLNHGHPYLSPAWGQIYPYLRKTIQSGVGYQINFFLNLVVHILYHDPYHTQPSPVIRNRKNNTET